MPLIDALGLFFVAGLAGGLLLGLIGVGMALIAVPLLTETLPHFGIAADYAPRVALATSMAIVAVGSVSSVVSHHRLGNVDWTLVKTTVPASLVGVVLGSLAVSHLPGSWLRWIFCVFLLVIAYRMLRKQPVQTSDGQATSKTTYRVAGGLIGVAGSLIGAGGGVFMVPFLNSRGHSMPKAVATSTAIGLPVSVIGALVYAFMQSPAPSLPLVGYVFWPAFVGIALGSVVAAPLGARLAIRVPANALRKGFALLLIVLAVRIVLE